MWRDHPSVYQDNMDYVRNDIVKPFKIKILRYAEPMREINDLAKSLPQPSTKDNSAKAANCNVRKQEFTDSEFRLAIKDRLPKYM